MGYLVGVFLTIWFALLVAPRIDNGILQVISDWSEIISNPFKVTICANSIRVTFIFLVVYILGILLYESSKKNYRRGEEHGSAKWGNAKEINKKYMQRPIYNNKILTKNVKIGLNWKKHRRNLNVLVCGGSRSW